jgi:hypothetical protein
MSVSTLAGTQSRWRAQALASGPLYTSRLAAARLLDGAEDQPCHGLRLRHHGRVRRCHFLDLRVPTLGHESLPRGRDGSVIGAQQVPRRDGPPPGQAGGRGRRGGAPGSLGSPLPSRGRRRRLDLLARAQVSIQGLPHVVVLLMGLDSSAAGVNALSWCANTARARAEYLLTRRQMLGKGAPD